MEREPRFNPEKEFRPKIEEMPDKDTLEAFLKHGEVIVMFNTEEGKFEWVISEEEKEKWISQS